MKANFSPLDAGPHRCTPQGTPHSLSKTPLQNQWITKYNFGASKGLWRFRMSLGVPEFRNSVCSLEMNQRHGWRKLMAADR